MKVLVTGAAGFIGSYISRALINRGDDVIGIDNFDDYYPRKSKEFNLDLVYLIAEGSVKYLLKMKLCRFLKKLTVFCKPIHDFVLVILRVSLYLKKVI